MPSSGMSRRVALARTDVSEDTVKRILVYIVFLLSVRRLLITANVPTTLIRVILMIEAVRSSETSAHTRATWRNIPEEGILQIICEFKDDYTFVHDIRFM
jgi:hypothetical protein